jgi:hypothetical protein
MQLEFGDPRAISLRPQHIVKKRFWRIHIRDTHIDTPQIIPLHLGVEPKIYRAIST